LKPDWVSSLLRILQYAFSKAKRGAVVPQTGKTRITIYIDDAVLEEFGIRADSEGKGIRH